jgi:L-2-hydroxyglutarate oxidase LhgO
MTKISCDVLIIGGGVIGMSVGIALLEANQNLKVVIAEKEEKLALHASGRNSGVVHAGFYYSPESLKASFCREGNLEFRKIARKFDVPFKEVGKVVVSRNADEDSGLADLYQRGIANNVEVELLSGKILHKYEPLAKTYNSFLWSPKTSLADPIVFSDALKKIYTSLGGKIYFNSRVQLNEQSGEVYDSTETYNAKFFINAAGAHSDNISRRLNVGLEFAMIPFIGSYKSTSISNLPLKRLVYPVPHPVNPFLGVHLTLTLNGRVKLGPTAMPVFGREQYSALKGWSYPDVLQIIKGLKSLVSGDAHDIGKIIKSELPKLKIKKLVEEAECLVPQSRNVLKWDKLRPGIRSQLVNLESGELVQDFIVQTKLNCTHVLNAVSPGWTSSIPFGRYIAEEVVRNI